MDRDEQMILSLLTALEDEPETTQKDLATQMGVAVGMVNSYLKRVIYKGYVKTKQLERRRLSYLITPTGIQEKARLTYEFLQFSYQFVRRVRLQVLELLRPIAKEGKTRVAFYGSGEMAELAYLALRELKLELVSVIDPSHVGENCLDHVIQDGSGVESLESAQILLVLEPKSSESACKRIVELAKDHQIDIVNYFK